ncbi:MAG: hypothetical protein PXX83_07795 [Candidatus Nitrosotalea sp.]|nr:hypothetical protein [Candidatus Nitrosotalea sp.]
MFQLHQLVGSVMMIIGIMMAMVGGVLMMNDGICNCPSTPGPVHVVIVPVLDGMLLYMGIVVSIAGMAIFVTIYFRKKPLVNN